MFLGDDSQSKEIQSILLKAIYFCQLPRDIVEINTKVTHESGNSVDSQGTILDNKSFLGSGNYNVTLLIQIQIYSTVQQLLIILLT